MGKQSVYNQYSKRRTPQSEPIPGKDMVKGRGGGYVFAVDKWGVLDRFLILGTESPTYYAGRRELLMENIDGVMACLSEDAHKTVQRVVDVSDSGRAPSNDPALFVLALAASCDNSAARAWALDNLPYVARTGTHLFHFASFVSKHRGWGRGLRRAIADWYNYKSPSDLAYQLVKYQQRDGWSHRDLLRLSHPEPTSSAHNALYRWAVGKPEETGIHTPGYELVDGYERAKNAVAESDIIRLIDTHGLTREMIPTTWLNSPAVWEALLEKMPMTALIRNLGKMTNVGLLKPMTNAESFVVSRLSDGYALTKSRVHPIQVLVALRTYQKGGGFLGKLSWHPTGRIVDALDDAFYASFGNVGSADKRMMLALDISGSMGWTDKGLSRMADLTPRELSAAMSMVTARTESNYAVVGFSHSLVPLDISPRQRLDDVVRTINSLPFGRTDCGLPMVYALKKKLAIDVFVVYTDNETWAGPIHPIQALQEYREATGIPAKLIVVGMVANNFSIADPNDGGMLDVVGFDTATPNVIANFSV